MDFDKVSKDNLKYVLASQLNLKNGQSYIRKLYNEDKIRFAKEEAISFYELFERNGVKIIAEWESEYPENLKIIDKPPILLFAKGNINILGNKCITIVGTRKNSSYGHRIVQGLIENIENEGINGICLVSGLAYGIDTLVHRYCLQNKLSTIVVVAGGINVGFPKRNAFLYSKIAEEGLILAEFPIDFEVRKGMFPMRNRILAGLSECTIVVEAPELSGSLITAHYSADMGKDVYSFPDNIFNNLSCGMNKLIKEGAIPLGSIEEAVDVVKEITVK